MSYRIVKKLKSDSKCFEHLLKKIEIKVEKTKSIFLLGWCHFALKKVKKNK